jgi:large subunit ribosomal protein L6
MRQPEISRTIEAPDGVTINLEGRKVTVKVLINVDGNKVRVWAEWPRKKEAALVGTIHSHIQNMITGVQKGFTYKLKIVFSHFPISVKVQGKTVLIENFTGERRARKANIVGDVKVKVEAEDIVVQGLNLEDVSQTAANIETITRVRRKDPRIFLDGLYVFERNEGME